MKLLLGALFSLFAATAAWAAKDPGAITVKWSIRGEPLILHSEPWFAGAISSIKFRGVEYLNSTDHGRVLQGAVQFEGMGECLNPTQAGASKDPPHRTSSELLWKRVSKRSYATKTRMAFWTRPGDTCTLDGDKVKTANKRVRSNVIYEQRMTLGFRGLPNAVLDRITVTTDRPHQKVVIEALTGYMPPFFDQFLVYDPKTQEFSPYPQLSETSPEVTSPVLIATADGKSAMGVVALTRTPPPHYGEAKFPDTSKWNAIYRIDGTYLPGAHTYECVWFIGTFQEVETAMKAVIGSSKP